MTETKELFKGLPQEKIDGTLYEMIQNPNAKNGRWTEPVVSVIQKQHELKSIEVKRMPFPYSKLEVKQRAEATKKKVVNPDEFLLYKQAAAGSGTFSAPVVTNAAEHIAKLAMLAEKSEAMEAKDAEIDRLSDQLEKATTINVIAKKEYAESLKESKDGHKSAMDKLKADGKEKADKIKAETKEKVDKMKDEHKAAIDKLKSK